MSVATGLAVAGGIDRKSEECREWVTAYVRSPEALRALVNINRSTTPAGVSEKLCHEMSIRSVGKLRSMT